MKLGLYSTNKPPRCCQVISFHAEVLLNACTFLLDYCMQSKIEAALISSLSLTAQHKHSVSSVSPQQVLGAHEQHMLQSSRQNAHLHTMLPLKNAFVSDELSECTLSRFLICLEWLA